MTTTAASAQSFPRFLCSQAANPLIDLPTRLILRIARLGLLLPLGGACAVSAVSLIVADHVSIPLFAVVFLCIYSSYLIDHLAEVEQFDESLASERSRLLNRRRLFATAGAISYLAALVITGCTAGWGSMVALLIFPLSVVLYALPVLRTLSFGLFPFARVKDIPGFKSVYTALFWGGLMWFACDFLSSGTLPVIVCLSLHMALTDFVNTVLCDFKDLERDRAEKVKTLPILLGTARTLDLLSLVNTLTVLVILVMSIAQAVSPALIGLAASNLVLGGMIRSARNSPRHHGWIGEAGADGAFILWLPGLLLARHLLEACL